MARARILDSHDFGGRLLRSVFPEKNNPAWRLSGTHRLGPSLGSELGWDPGALDRVAAIWAPRVGLLEMRRPGDTEWRPVCTAIHLPGMGPRMLTARHALVGEISGTANILDYPFKAFEGISTDNRAAWVSEMRVRFADAAGGDGAEIAATSLWCHRDADMLVLRLDRLPDAALADDAAFTAAPRPVAPVRIAVLGYPLRGVSSEHFLPPAQGAKHLSAGTLSPAAPGADLARHDAPTESGFSGGAVIDLASGAFLGLHLQGASRDDWTANRALLMDVLARDDCRAMREVMLTGSARPRRPRTVYALQHDGGSGSGLEAVRRIIAKVEAGDTAGLADEALLSGLGRDRPDFRDYPYRPVLVAARDRIAPPEGAAIIDQGDYPSCAAAALAAVLAVQNPARRASIAMLDAMARSHDEFPGETGPGTSLRGVLKGFFHNGVCTEELGGSPGAGWRLTRDRIANARDCVLGAYYRIGRSLTDMQMAIQETGAILVSAQIHSGWLAPERGMIAPGGASLGGHAFAVTGYQPEGFIVQNSWGPGWGGWDGRPGHALWRYEDWAQSVIDAWALRTAPPAPTAFDLLIADPADPLPRPRRAHLGEHLAIIESDRLVDSGSIGIGLDSLRETAAFLSAGTAERPLLLIFHDPFIGTDLALRLAARMTPDLKRRGIYPLHLLYGFDEILTCTLRVQHEARRLQETFRAAGHDPAALPGPTGRHLERTVAPVIRRSLASFQQGLTQALDYGPLWQAIAAIVPELPEAAPVSTLACGAGCLIEAAVHRRRDLGLPTRCARTWLAPVRRGAAGVSVLRLAAGPCEGDIAGYAGDWPDLVAAAPGLGGRPRAAGRTRDALAARSLREALGTPGVHFLQTPAPA